MADISVSNIGSGVAFMVAAGLVYEIIAAMCSSPQTAEINAKKRSATLMKWVNVGVANAALFVVIAAYLDPKRSKAIYAGGITAVVLMYAAYWHAKRAGLASDEPGTESY